MTALRPYQERRDARKMCASALCMIKNASRKTVKGFAFDALKSSQQGNEFYKMSVITPKKSEVFNSGFIRVGEPLDLEQAPRVLLWVQNQGITNISLTDNHWHKDLGTLRPGEHKTILAAAVAANTASSIGKLCMQLLDEERV